MGFAAVFWLISHDTLFRSLIVMGASFKCCAGGKIDIPNT